jgi:hypothetical protein
MTLHIFHCSTLTTRHGLTPDRTGSNLPKDKCTGEWIYLKTIEVNRNDPGRIGAAPANEILDAIERDGYYINDVSITFTEREL